MASNLAHLPEPEPLRAITISRDVQDFDLLIEDMEAELGEGWGDLSFVEAQDFLRQDEARELEFVVIAANEVDEERLSQVMDVIRDAKRAGLAVILVAEGISPVSMHELLRSGADDFAPYPLPEQALAEAIARIRAPGRGDVGDVLKRAGADMVESKALPSPGAHVGTGAATLTAVPAATTGGGGFVSTPGEGALFALQSTSGGNGATTIAVNLAWEWANISKHEAPKVCLIDLGLQFGSVATYLDLPRKATIYDVLTDVGSMDEQGFKQALLPFKDKLHVFTAPQEVLPLDVVGPEEIATLLRFARQAFDVVIVDMPNALTPWTEEVLTSADLFFLVCELEMRSAQNTLRFQRLLQSEGIAMDRLGYLLNRGPGKLDMGGRARIDKFASSLDVKFNAILPDGGKQVTEVNDQAEPLRELAASNALTKEIAKLAKELHAARQAIEGGREVKKKKSIFGLSFG
ncbi:AAA family ATPase [Jannaschia seohaensis]|uniref:Pilus assembly protein CpaE n=1 Tax=Jannaschia seohaensis TaxID=475081 RepID=A0A2Y9B1F4_9RHOB|nr:AAA family ATPase [Jannaschia seohaensis]PWJ15016.1 pilus assembly protein CpaE [Jannaschia seohaensis]SSA49865.1 pilus assembly protein CpaE [Jannaschia seohaensis]